MSLLLCRHEPVKNPYYIEELGIHLTSSQELCYVIYNNPLLALDHLVCPGLLDFIRQDLDMPVLARKLQALTEAGADSQEMLFLILSECDYYTEAEQNGFKQTVAALKKLHPGVYRKARADDLFQKKQYGKAAAQYKRLLEFPRDKTADEQFFAKVSHNLGAVYAQMFQFDKAFSYLDRAYQTLQDEQILKEIYFLTVFDPEMPVKDRYFELFTESRKTAWDQELEKARQNALAAPQVIRLRELFKKDPVRRIDGAEKIVRRWKQEYRRMI